MKTSCLFLLLAASALVVPARAADPITESFQKALFEEEANQNLDAAIQAYRAVITATDAQRKLAATAVFRLGECYRKLAQTNAAVGQYQRLLRDFADQTNLVMLSQQNLVGLGGKIPDRETGPDARLSSPASRLEQQRLFQEEIKLAEQQLDTLKRQIAVGVVPKEDAIAKERELLALRRQMAALDIGPAMAPEAAAADAGATDDEGKEIRRIQALIRNSPDLVNGAGAGGQTSLMLAAQRGHLTVARFLLAAKADVSARDQQDATALHYAVTAGQKTMTELLLASGAGVNAQDNAGRSPLFFAAERGFRTVAEVLLEQKADVQLKDNAGRTPLFAAADAGQADLVDVLLRHGADMKARDTDGSTPLHMATSKGRDTVVTLLLEHKAEVDAKDNGGLTPLALAVPRGQAKTADLLLKAGADPHVQTGGTPLLHVAIGRGENEVLKLLLAQKPDLDATDRSGFTPVQLAVTRYNVSGATESVRLLLEAGADPNRPYSVIGESRFVPPGAANKIDSTGCSPLAVASFLGDVDKVKNLLAHGAEVNAKSSAGMTPLLYAVEKKSMPMLEAVLAHKPDTEVRIRDGYTALALAIARGELKIAEKLIQAGAGVNAELSDAAMSTPLHMAVMRKSKDWVALLLANKAAMDVVNKQGQTPLDMAQDLARQSTPVGDPEGFAAIADLLLKRGADENFTLRSHIVVGRGARGARSRLFIQGTNEWNRYTLLELLAAVYANPDNEPSKSLSFPDLSRVTIDRLGDKGERGRSFTVDVATVLNSGDCTNAPWLDWGDLVNIPELDHPVNEQWLGLAPPVLAALTKCLQREVEIVIKGQNRKGILTPSFQRGGLRQGLMLPPPPGPRTDEGPIRLNAFRLNEVLRGSGLLRVSSDLTRVRVRRTDPMTRQPVEWTVNLSPDHPYDARTDLWLRDGDVIEVPER